MGAYQITVRVFQTNPNTPFHYVIEQTVWHYANGGSWSESKGQYLLHMNGSGTSGILRFQTDATTPEYFVVALGIHNYKPWGSIVADLKPDQTGVALHSQFYSGGTYSKAQLNDVGTHSVSPAKGQITLTIKDNGNSNYTADVIIA